MDIGRILAQLDNRITAMERSARLSHASLDATALEVRDGSGSLRGIVGQQADGTTGVNIVNGPVPPTPSPPTVAAALGALSIAWDGTFAGTVAAPLDWMRVEVHVGPDSAFTPSQATLRDTIESPQGGTAIVALPYTEWWVKLRSRTTSGVASTATTAVAGTPRKAGAPDLTAGAVTADKIDVDALDGKTLTGSTIRTAAAGRRLALESASGEFRVYDASNVVVAAVTPDIPNGTAFDQSGFVAYDSTGTAFAALTRGQLLFSSVGSSMLNETGASAFTGADPKLSLSSGCWTGTDAAAWLTLQSGTSGGNAELRAESYPGGRLDFKVTGNANVSGLLTAGNIVTGTTTITPSAAHTATSANVSYPTLPGTTFRAYVTANTTVPGVRTPLGNFYGVTGVSVSSVTANGMLVWVNRENTTATVINWMVISS